MKKLVSVLLYLCGVALIGLDVYLEFQGGQTVTMSSRLLLAGLILILMLISYNMLAAAFPGGKSKIFGLTVWLLFFYYLSILISLLFFSYGMGRHVVRQGLNLDPLTTIRNYYVTYRNGHLTQSVFFTNILGNLLAFAPFGFFGPVLFEKMRSFWGFLWRMGVMIALVEIVQLMTYTGSCDVDDWILNMAGAVVVYLWMQLPYFNKIRR